MKFRGSLFACLAVCALPAQIVQFTATAVTPIDVGLQMGPLVLTSSQPAGLLPPLTYLTASLLPAPSGLNVIEFSCNLDQGLQPTLSLRAVAITTPLGSAQASTTTGLVDILLQVAAAVPVLGNLEVEHTTTASVGSATPLQRIDVGDDGTFEFTEYSNPGVTNIGINLGPQSLPIRVQFELGTTGQQAVDSLLRLRFVADNDLIITPAIAGCTADTLFALPSFQGLGLDLGVQPMLAGDLSLGVVGLGVQPVVVSTIYPGCVLLPSPDVVFVMPSSGTVNLPLPPSLRPLILWVQGVVLSGSHLGTWDGTLTTTQGYRIDAW